MRREVNHIGSCWRAACALCFVFENNIFMLISQRLLLMQRLIIPELHLISALWHYMCVPENLQISSARGRRVQWLYTYSENSLKLCKSHREAPRPLIYFCGCFTSHFLLRNCANKPRQTNLCVRLNSRKLSFSHTKLLCFHILVFFKCKQRVKLKHSYFKLAHFGPFKLKIWVLLLVFFLIKRLCKLRLNLFIH